MRRSILALKTAAKSCNGRFGLVHSRFCYAAADLALNRTAIAIAIRKGVIRSCKFFQRNRKRFKN